MIKTPEEILMVKIHRQAEPLSEQLLRIVQTHAGHVVFPIDEFKAQSKHFVFCHIDTDEQKSVASSFNVGGIPDLRFLKADGTEVHKVVGYEGMALLNDMDKAWEMGKG